MNTRLSRTKIRRAWNKAQQAAREIEHRKMIHAHAVAFLLKKTEVEEPAYPQRPMSDGKGDQ